MFIAPTAFCDSVSQVRSRRFEPARKRKTGCGSINIARLTALAKKSSVATNTMKRSILFLVLASGLAIATLQMVMAQTSKAGDARLAEARKAIDAGNVEWVAGQK